MGERMKSFGWTLFGVFFIVALFSVIGALIWGAGWLSSKVLPVLNVTSFFLVPIALFLFIPLGFVRHSRAFAGNGLYLSSFVFGLTLWMTSLLVTLQLWGLGAAVVGICLAGIGVVPVAFLATLFAAEWVTLASLLLLTFLTFGSRALGIQRLVRAAVERAEAKAALQIVSSPSTV